MSASAPRMWSPGLRTILLTEYQLSTHGSPLVAMTEDVGTELQRDGLRTREQVTAALSTAADLAAPGPAIGAYQRLDTVIALASQWAPLWLVYSPDAGGYIATWPRDRA